MAGEKVKLTDEGSNELEFYVDSYVEVDQDYDNYARANEGSLKHYTVTSKKEFMLGVKNISNSDKDTLKIIYDLRTAINFYRKENDGSETAEVMWKGPFNLHTPTNKSHAFMDSIYEGTITLVET